MRTHAIKKKDHSPEFMTVSQIAKLLQLNETTVYRMLQKKAPVFPHRGVASKSGHLDRQ